MKKPALLILFTLLLLATAACSAANDGELGGVSDEPVYATITMESGGVIKLELYPDIAPQSVYNFVSLARAGFYDGLTFHRVMEGFMIQGGCPKGDGTGGPGYTITGEFSANGIKNDLKHERGVISMARTEGNYNSAGSQFFIMHETTPSLDGNYAAFGRVIEGMDVVNRIAKRRVKEDKQTPLAKIVIASVTIDGPELPEPDKLS